MVHRLDAATVRTWCRTGLAGLADARQEIDAINVYPVADGDTGSNLCSTMLAVVRELDAADGDPPSDLSGTLRAVTRAALLGARGNSGVILSQMLRGLADALVAGGESGADARALARGLTRAAELAYQAVGVPVEGTVLTVARAAASGASKVADSGGTLVEVAQAAADGARAALAHTPDQLGVLQAAGVVDAGGRGLVVLIEALAAVLRGDGVAESQEQVSGALPMPMTRPLTVPDKAGLHVAPVELPRGVGREEVNQGDAVPEPGDAPFYEVMYLLTATTTKVAELREELAAMGDSLVVVGDEELWNVHVHVADAGGAVEAGLRAGRPHRVRITYLGDAARAQDALQRRVVAIAPGDGLAKVLQSAGAAVVTSQPDEAPAVEALLGAVQGACAREVVVLPDGEHTRAVAEAVAEKARASGLRLAVLPTRAAVQVIAALAVHDPERDFDDDVVAMTAAARSTRHGEVCVATSEAVTTAGVCGPGDVLGLVEGDVAVIGTELPDVALEVVNRLLAAGGELVTVVSGQDAAPELAKDVLRQLHEARPDVDTVSYEGGQPAYPLLVGVE